MNTGIIIEALQAGPQTRDQLVQKLHAPRTTIYDPLRRLIKDGKVVKYPLFKTAQVRGRPQVLFSLMEERS